jgi:hypothetical protein
MKIIAGVLISGVLVSSNAMCAEESSEHLKNVSKAVSAQLLRMKLKKEEDKKLKASAASFKVNAGEKTQQQTKKADAKPDTVLVTEKKQALKQVVKNKKDSKKPAVSNQQKNDNLRFEIQNIVNNNPD